MAQEKYQQLVKIVRDINEKNANTELDCLKLLFKKFVFGEKEIPAMQELWFEKKEIKDDAEYYQLIHSLISSFIIHCSDKRLKADMLTKDIFTLFENTKILNISIYIVILLKFLIFLALETRIILILVADYIMQD